MGVYSTSQFLGVFVGGQLGGALYQWVGAEAVFYGCAALAAAWLVVLAGLQELPKLDNRVLILAPDQDWHKLARDLQTVPGVVETVIVEEQALALLKVDAGQLDEARLAGLAGAGQS
jgi:MFS family permease